MRNKFRRGRGSFTENDTTKLRRVKNYSAFSFVALLFTNFILEQFHHRVCGVVGLFGTQPSSPRMIIFMQMVYYAPNLLLLVQLVLSTCNLLKSWFF